MILLSEMTRNRIRSVKKLTRVGNLEIASVLRKDEAQGFIDLSKKSVSKDEAALCEMRYNKSKTVYSMIQHLSETHKIEIEKLYEMIVFPLARKFNHAYDAFRYSIEYGHNIFSHSIYYFNNLLIFCISSPLAIKLLHFYFHLSSSHSLFFL